MDSDTVVIGGEGTVGETLAGGSVVFLDEDERAVERAAEAGADARVADPSEAATQRRSVGIVETERSSDQETAKRRLGREESTDDPERERLRSDGMGGGA
jgi:hypothetical protein